MVALLVPLLAPLVAQGPLVATEELPQAFQSYLAPLVESGAFSGTILVARGDEILVEKAFGFADIESAIPNSVETSFKLMSVSKPLCAITVMRLAEAGLLSLDDPAGDYLANWPDAWSEITLHHLAEHTSGFANLEGVWSRAAWGAPGVTHPPRGLALWKQIAPELAGNELEARAGARQRYSNFNYELVGAVIESVTGESYGDVLRERVLAPAKMTRTGIDDGTRRAGLAVGYFRRNGAPSISEQDMSRIQAAGGVYSTARDLWKLDRALASESLLDAESQRVMEAPRKDQYAVGWSRFPVHGRRAVHHSGGSNGYVAYLLRLPQEDACIIALSNFAFAPITRIAYDLAGILLGEDVARPRVASEDQLDALVGTYRGEGGWPTVALRRSGGLLLAHELWSRETSRVSGKLILPVEGGKLVRAFGDSRLAHEGERLQWTTGNVDRWLERAETGVLDWRARTGGYSAAHGARSRLRIEAEEDRMWMVVDDRVVRYMLVPVTPTLALTLYDDLGGTALISERETLRWSSPGLGWIEYVRN